MLRHRRRLRWGLFAWLLASTAAADDAAVSSWHQPAKLGGAWRLQVGDERAWASLRVDDSDWPTLALPEPAGLRERPQGPVIWLRRTVQGPAERPTEPLSIALGGVTGAYEVYCNGKLVGAAGQVDQGSAAGLLPRVFALPDGVIGDDGRVVVALRVRQHEAFSRVSPSVRRLGDGSYQLGPSAIVEPIAEAERAQLWARAFAPEVLCVSIALVVAALYAALWLRRSQLDAHLWFSLFLLMIALSRTGNLLAARGGDLGEIFPVKLLPVGMLASLFFGIELFTRLLEARRPRALARVLQGAFALCAATLIVSDVATVWFVTHGLTTLLLGVMGLALVAMAARSAIRGRREAKLLLAGCIAIGALLPLSSYLLTAHRDLYSALPLPPWAIAFVLFVLCMAVLLGDQFVRALEEAQRREGEVLSLNDELRRQIELRSEQLAAVLARLGGAAGHEARLVEGAVINGRYRVRKALGEGAMGAVYEVERIGDQARLALKVLSAEGNARSLARFAREAQAASKLAHPAVLRVLDIDVSQTGGMFVVMELAAGGSLEDMRHRFGDRAFALPVLRQLAEGLAALHEAGVVHRDLKLANVLLDAQGNVKIADFGIALLSSPSPPSSAAGADPALSATQTSGRLALDATVPADSGATAATLSAYKDAMAATVSADSDAMAATVSADSDEGPPVAPGSEGRLTSAGAFVGTPLYMAPELSRGAGEAGPASDVWAFGVLAAELLTGAFPFEKVPFVCAVYGLPIPPPRLPQVDPALAALVTRCLSERAEDRPTARALVEALASL